MNNANSSRSGKSGSDDAVIAPVGDTMTDSHYITHIIVYVAAAAVLIVAGAYAMIRFISESTPRKTVDQDAATGARSVLAPSSLRTQAPSTATMPSVTKKHDEVDSEPAVFAALVRGEQARPGTTTPETAAALIAGGKMRWAGLSVDWDKRIAEMGLARLEANFSGDDVILTFHAHLSRREMPSNRLDTRRCLERLANSGALTLGDVYSLPVGVDPSRFGFKEF